MYKFYNSYLVFFCNFCTLWIFCIFGTFWTEPPFRAILLLGDPPSRGLLYSYVHVVCQASLRCCALQRIVVMCYTVSYLELRSMEEALRGDVSQPLPRPVLFAEDTNNNIWNQLKLVRLCGPQNNKWINIYK